MNKIITLTLMLINLITGFMNYSIGNYAGACYSFTVFGMMLMLLINQIIETPNQNG